MKRLLFLTLVLLSSCGQDPAATVVEPSHLLDCGPTEVSMYSVGNPPKVPPPYLVTLDPGMDVETLVAVRTAENKWNSAVGSILFDEEKGNAEVHLALTAPSRCTSSLLCVSTVVGGSELNPLTGFWGHELGHALGLLHPWGNGLPPTPEQWASLDDCTKQSIMASVVGQITQDAVDKIKSNFNL